MLVDACAAGPILTWGRRGLDLGCQPPAVAFPPPAVLSGGPAHLLAQPGKHSGTQRGEQGNLQPATKAPSCCCMQWCSSRCGRSCGWVARWPAPPKPSLSTSMDL
jgi:hypothetical protein